MMGVFMVQRRLVENMAKALSLRSVRIDRKASFTLLALTDKAMAKCLRPAFASLMMAAFMA